MLKKWIKLSLLWLGLIALVLFHYVTGITPLILKADTFDSYVDYSYFNVPNFDDYTAILKSSTVNLDYYLKLEGSFDYSFNSCPVIGGKMADVSIANRVTTPSNVVIDTNDTYGGQLYCSQAYETYDFSITIPLQETSDLTNYILNIDDNYIFFNNYLRITGVVQSYGVQMTISNWNIKQWLEIDFNNTYLMSTFLLESDWINNPPFNNTINRPFVLYAETQSDRYNVYNDNLSTTFDNRTKFAIEIPNIDSALVVNKIGTGWESSSTTNYVMTLTSSIQYIQSNWRVYTLNAAPMPTPFDDVAIDTTPNYSICDYVLGFPIDCTLDGVPIGSFQAMANDLWEWTIKESPIFSDVWTLASGGFQWLSNTFQFLGYFDVDSLLGGILALLIGVIVMLWAWVGG